MSMYQKHAIGSLISALIVFTTYTVIQMGALADGKFEGEAGLRYIGISLIVLVVVAIISEIVVNILFMILHAIVTNTDTPDFTIDERDRMIEANSLRWVVVLSGIGAVLGFVLLAFSFPLVYVFHVIFGGLAVGHFVGNLRRLSAYYGKQ